jgi:ubiquinone/menaquinone biosynthesis C-methylase UbiE
MDHSGTALIDPYPIFKAIGLGASQRVADLGCGRTGHFVFPASRIVGSAGVVYAVDVVKDILENIKSRARTEGYDNVQTAWADIERPGGVPIPSSNLDTCFMVNVLSLLGNIPGALQEVARILKPGGKIAVVDWAKKLGPLGPKQEKIITSEKAKQLFNSAGFNFISEQPAGAYHTVYIFERT